VSAYDLRVVESLRSAPEVEAQDWAWRAGVMRIRRAQADPVAGRSSEVLLAADLRTEGGRKAAILLAREVLPLLRQRVSRASLSLVGPTDGSYLEVSGRSNVLVADVSEPLDAWIQGAAVLVAGPVGDAVSARAERLAADLGVPIVRGVATASPSSATGLAERLSAYLGTAAEG
jgi:Asp/Glu/hydantoin racemase